MKEACFERGLEGIIASHVKQNSTSFDSNNARSTLKEWLDLQQEIYRSNILRKDEIVPIFAHSLLFKSAYKIGGPSEFEKKVS